MKVSVTLSELDKLEKALDDYKNWIKERTQVFLDKLADIGVTAAEWGFETAYYVGENDVKVKMEPRGENARAVIATGNATLFIEFGAGYLMGYGHPEPMGFGPGTYPGKGHWDDPNGWWLPKEVQEQTGMEKSYGNPPAMPMYNAVKHLEQEFERIAREVFK